MARSKLAGLALICSLAAGCGGKDIVIDGSLQPADPIEMTLADDKTSNTWSRYLSLREKNGKSNAESDLVNVLLVLDKDADGEIEFNELRRAYLYEVEAYQEAHPDCCLDGKSCKKQAEKDTNSKRFCISY